MNDREPGNMNDRESGAFHSQYMSSDMHVWIKTFFKLWTELMCLVLKVVLLPCSASEYEHRWSIEDSTHSKRKEKQTWSGVCRSSRAHSHELHARPASDTLWVWYAPVGHWDDGLQPSSHGSIPLGLTPSLNPKMTLTKFLRHLT
jgi:hypothetical protein